jgi:hypothetical protein
VVCFLTHYRSACAEYNLFPIKSYEETTARLVPDKGWHSP